MSTLITLAILLLLFLVWKTCLVVPMREHVVKERLGKFAGVLQPGLHLLIPFVDRMAYRQEMREQVIDVPPQACITRDNIQVEVDGLVYLRVMDAEKASYGIGNYTLAAINLCQTTMRSEIGKLSLDNTFSEREAVNENIVREVDKASEPWGIKLLRYEIRNITPSVKVVETLEKQMEAERRKRAEITLATADKESRINLSLGERQEEVNLSQGERQRRINLATGRAKEIELLAEASAFGIRRVAEALQKPGGPAAMRMRIVEQYIDELGKILRDARVSVLPVQLAALKGFFEGVARVTGGGGPLAAPGPEPRK
jgi:regulator of protease activity HflC (stomatin/prohibitin superfamily)